MKTQICFASMTFIFISVFFFSWYFLFLWWNAKLHNKLNPIFIIWFHSLSSRRFRLTQKKKMNLYFLFPFVGCHGLNIPIKNFSDNSRDDFPPSDIKYFLFNLKIWIHFSKLWSHIQWLVGEPERKRRNWIFPVEMKIIKNIFHRTLSSNFKVAKKYSSLELTTAVSKKVYENHRVINMKDFSSNYLKST